jgi:hypothetical protein
VVPLTVPNESNPGRQDPLRYGSVRLFVERPRGAEPRFSIRENWNQWGGAKLMGERNTD